MPWKKVTYYNCSLCSTNSPKAKDIQFTETVFMPKYINLFSCFYMYLLQDMQKIFTFEEVN